MEYLHGGDIYGDNKIDLDFSVNTNPFGMPRSIMREVVANKEEWACYPDSRCRALRDALAGFYSGKQRGKTEFSPEDFICGNGAADLLYSLIFALRPRKALLFVPAFDEYERALQAVGCEIKKICLDEQQDFSMTSVETDRFTEDIDIMILGNPNNPTGMALDSLKVREWADICKERHIFFVIDECFNGFLKNPDTYSMAPYLSDYDNLFLLRAFTKIYAMAGLRLGYGICKNREVMERIENCRQPWSVSGAAMRAGLQALQEEAFVKMTEEFVSTEREFLAAELTKLGFKVYPSRVNYLLFRRFDRIDYEDFLKKQGILIRSCRNFAGLDDNYYRVAVKLRAENERLLECFAKAKEKGGG